MIDPSTLMQAVMESRDGVTISDATLPDNPLIFVNPAFEKMTGYTREEIINRNCRFLQGTHRDQRYISDIKEAVNIGKHCLVTIQNYRKDGSMFWNELSISPVLDASGKLIQFIGIQKDVTARVEFQQQLSKEREALKASKFTLENLVINDGLTGIYNRRHFDNELKRLSQHLVRTESGLTLMMIDVDHFKKYNDTYGHVAGDKVLKTVAATLSSSMKRLTELTARYGGEEFVVLATDLTSQQALSQAQTLCQIIESLKIPHAKSTYGFITISCGVSHISQESVSDYHMLLNQADEALYHAKSKGRNQAFMYQSNITLSFEF